MVYVKRKRVPKTCTLDPWTLNWRITMWLKLTEMQPDGSDGTLLVNMDRYALIVSQGDGSSLLVPFGVKNPDDPNTLRVTETINDITAMISRCE